MTQGKITALSIVGAACYAAWGCLHLMAGYNVYLVGVPLEPSMVKGRVFQDAWNLFFFGATAISVALILNIRNSKWGYWINLWVTSLADTGLIFFVLIPGYWSWWPGLAGPILWGFGFTFTTLAYVRNVPAAMPRPSRT
jgi:hypothetical protein